MFALTVIFHVLCLKLTKTSILAIMANTCDFCKDSFPTTVAFLQHIMGCSAAREEGFRVQQSPRGEKETREEVTREKETREEETSEEESSCEEPREEVARKAAKTAAARVGGSGGVDRDNFKCHLCDAVLCERAKLANHFRKVHKKTMSEGEVRSEMAKRPKDPTAACKYCGQTFLKRSLVTHYKTCKKVPRVKGATVEGNSGATNSQDLNVSRDSLVSRAGNLDIAEEPEVMSEDQFLQGFQKYMENKNQGNLSGSSPRLYREKIIHFLNFWKGQRQDFSAGKLANFGSKAHFIRLPHTEEWEGTIGSANSRSQGLSAYKMLIKYLRFLNYRALDLMEMDEDEVYRREGHLDRMEKEAAQRLKNLDSQKTRERRENEEDRENLEEGDLRRRIPGEELKRISDLYATSELRETMYRDLGERMEEVLRRNIHIPTDVRDFCAFEVLFESGGMRSDAIYKMTLKELYRSKKVGNGKRAILGHEQKTKNSYGAAQLIIPERLYNLLLLYVKHARPLLFVTEKKPEGDDYVFISQTSKTAPKANRLYSMSRCTKFFEKVNEANDGTYKTRCHDFRRLVATLAQEHDDPTVRESQPLLMGHSKSTVDLHYRSRTSKLAQHASNIDQLWAPAQGGDNLPSVEVDEEEIEQERLRIESEAQEKRDKEKSERERKRKAAAPRVEGKFQFADGDHDIIRRAFEFAKDCDGNQLGTITLAQGKHKTKSHFYQAYDSSDRDREFRRMVDRLAGEFDGQTDRNGKEINFTYIRTKIGDAYHAMQRKAKKSGKAKGPQPGTSKSAKKPAPKRRRGGDDSDSEEEESSEFSEESDSE